MTDRPLPMLRWQLGTPPVDGTTALVFGGDFCPVGRFGERLAAGGEIFHSALAALFGAHYTLFNLETPLCHADTPSDSPSGAGLRGAPAVARYLASLGVDAVSLANNHARDFGDDGLRQTIANLDAAGVLTVGAGENLAVAEMPLELTLDGTRVVIWALAEKELNLASESRPGTSWFRPEHNLGTIAALKARCDVLVVVVHAGHEFVDVPSPRIRDAYRAFIDAGADAVIAHHPHVPQGAERRGSGVIAYSQGNLVFDTPYVSRHPHTDSGYLVRLHLADRRLNAVDFIPYRLHDGTTVEPLNDNSFADFESRFATLSGHLADDCAFARAWEAAAGYRWVTEYRAVLSNFSTNLHCPDNPDFARRSRNLFACPTHSEMIETIFLLIEAGKLAR